MLPEKLPTNKYIVELEPTGDGADDMTGDAGAVGRMIVSGGRPPCADSGMLMGAAGMPARPLLAV